jgi:hypothetical protein
VKARRLTLVVLCYVSLDLSSPFVPGAFNFNPDESIDGVQRHRETAVRRLVAAPKPPPSLTAPDLDLVRHTAGAFASPQRAPRMMYEWLVDVRRAHAPVPEVSSLSEDH